MDEIGGERSQAPKNDVGGVAMNPTERGAWIVAGAVLLGSIMIAATLLVAGGSRGNGGTDTPTPAPTAQAPGEAQAPTVSIDTIKSFFGGKNITFGKKDSKVIFVEISDPSCPYCHIAGGKNAALNKQAGAQFLLTEDGGSYVAPVPEMKKLVDAGKASFVWIYANGHGNGELATKALYCAHEKGKFWPAHDLLMSEAGYTLINDTVKNDKAKAGVMADFLKGVVNQNEMKQCLESGKYDDRIAADSATAGQLGFRGTPSFFVNATNFAGAQSYATMKPTVDELLK